MIIHLWNKKIIMQQQKKKKMKSLGLRIRKVLSWMMPDDKLIS